MNLLLNQVRRYKNQPPLRELRFRAAAFFARDQRTRVANEYLKGEGIELGALHFPLPIHPGRCRVRYVDRMPELELRKHYPELATVPLVPIDLIDDGEKLERVPHGSLDFLIANHFLEHCENPLGTLEAFLSRLKPGGRAFLAVPDKRLTFDRNRELTSWAHVLEDYQQGPERSRRQHYLEWAEHVNGAPAGPPREARAEELLAIHYSIHFHVWDDMGLLDFLIRARDFLRPSFQLLHFCQNPSGSELIVVLERAS